MAITTSHRLALAAALLALTGTASAQNYVPIEKRLNMQQLHDTGLDQLSRQQLDLLNSLLSQQQATVVSEVRAKAESAPRAKSEERRAFESRIVGDFRGWSTGTSFMLENGQRWQVTEGDFSTRKVASPRVTLKPGLVSGWYMTVQGQPVTAKVRQVK